ncbi:MAG: pilus assembly protein PilM [Planctomycetaceae bacterium]|nr:pilus assembly protein PilM [Planctomycetaceae bacterium]
MSTGSRFFRSDSAADYVALDWESGSLRWAAARIADGRVTLADWASLEWTPDVADVQNVAVTAERLKQALGQLSARSPRALIVLPREVVVVRKLELPSVPENELPDLVRLQAATKLATPVDKLGLDYLPLSVHEEKTGLAVLLVSVEQERLQRIHDAVKAAGLEPAGCVTSSISVAELALRGVGATTGLKLVVYQHRQRLELSALLDRELIFSYSLTLPSIESAAHAQPLMAELSRVVVAVRQAHHATDIERVLVIQEGEPDEPVLAVLRERFGERLHVLSPDEIGRGAMLDGAARPNASAAALGALAAEAHPLIPGVDFLRPRKAAAQADPLRRKKLIAGAAAGLLLLLAAGTYYGKLSDKNNAIASLDKERNRITQLLAEPESKATLSAAQSINAWSAEVADPLTILSRFQSLLPGTDQLYFTSLRLTPQAGDIVGRLDGNGFARTRRHVDDFYQRLADAGYAVVSKPVTSSSRNPDYPVAFELNVSVMPEQPAPRKVAGGPGTSGNSAE